jgi:hypothetical protein
VQQRLVVSGVGAVLVAMLVLGALDTLVWLPQHLAPGIPLDRIYDALSASRDLPSILVTVAVWFGFWAFWTALYVVLLLPALRVFRPLPELLRPIGVLAIGCLLIGAVGFFHWWSAFGMGMSVSDELPPGVGGLTPFGSKLELGAILVGFAGVFFGVLAIALRPRPAAAAVENG